MRASSSQAALQHYKNTCADKLVKIYQYSPHQTTRHPTERHLKQINARVTGLLILTGRPVDQPAGRPAFLAILAGQNWPKLKMFRK